MPADNNRSLDNLFHPASIAVIGASSKPAEIGWVKRLLDFGYKGKIYPINPKAHEIYGVKAYPSIWRCADSVEYAILNIPSGSTPQAMRDCAIKRVKFVHCYTAGFKETGTAEGRQLEVDMI